MNSLFALEDSVRPTFGGHEKFVFRHGWLKKGVDAVARNPAIFTQDDAVVELGVGKNMVRSIRFWCVATGLLDEIRAGGQVRAVQLSELARRLICDDGWDPYLEDDGTLWLLHWQLTSNLARTLVWHLAFSAYYESEFTKKHLSAFIGRQLEKRGVETTSGMVERDVDCFLRTYCPGFRTKPGFFSEESLDCPLTELDLIRHTSEDHTYRFNIGPKVTLPPAVFGYALLKFLPRVARNRRTVAVDECVYQYGSPGQVFKLDENSVVEHLEKIEDMTDGRLRIDDTAGLRQVYLQETTDDSWRTAAFDLLDRYYV